MHIFVLRNNRRNLRVFVKKNLKSFKRVFFVTSHSMFLSVSTFGWSCTNSHVFQFSLYSFFFLGLLKGTKFGTAVGNCLLTLNFEREYGNVQSSVMLFSSHTTRGDSNLSFYSWFCVQNLEEITILY